MLAGYDYLILRGGARRFWTRTRIAGASLVIAGGLLIGLGGAYYGYASSARASLEKYQVSKVELVPVYEHEAPEARLAPSSNEVIPEASLYSGDAGAIRMDTGPDLPQGFALINFATEESPLTEQPAATRLRIPAIGIESTVVELSVRDLGDQLAYQTPNRTVGHIPETNDAGEHGEAWFFGHTESPILDEGSVFLNLQQIPDLLRAGKDVQIITDNGTEEFLYQVTATRVVHEDDLTLESGGGPQIHLVSCVPRLVYDHRLIVDAELIASRARST